MNVLEVRATVLLVIIGAGLVTVIPRVVPLALLSRIQLPNWAIRWLGYVPIAVLAGLLAQSVMLVDGHIVLPPQNLALMVVIPTLLVAVWKQSMIATMIVGIVGMALLRWIVG
jgi:branched-subunit amino acid transport protein